MAALSLRSAVVRRRILVHSRCACHALSAMVGRGVVAGVVVRVMDVLAVVRTLLPCICSIRFCQEDHERIAVAARACGARTGAERI